VADDRNTRSAREVFGFCVFASHDLYVNESMTRFMTRKLSIGAGSQFGIVHSGRLMLGLSSVPALA
jgi:hypothetical protein